MIGNGKGNGPKFTVKQITDALIETKGMVYLAADILGCSAQTIYNYAKRHPTIPQTIENERGKFLDKTEMALDNAIDAGEGWAIAFALKTLGKQRGYVEKQQIEQTNIEVDLNSLTDEQLKRLAKGENIASVMSDK